MMKSDPQPKIFGIICLEYLLIFIFY